MKVIVENNNSSIKVALTVLRLAGLWAPDEFQGAALLLYHCHTLICLMSFLGIFIIVQLVDLYRIWGDLALMAGVAFLLCTNLVQVAKIVNILARRRRVGALVQTTEAILYTAVCEEELQIIKRCDRETSILQGLYFFITTITTIGWATSAEKNSLPLPRAWYPYDASKSPAFELTFTHQVASLVVAAFVNMAKDTLVAGLIAQNKCQLQLLSFRLRRIHEGMGLEKSVACLTPSQEKKAMARLRGCVEDHQTALSLAPELQACFSVATFAQFVVSLLIICVTAFQLSQTKNLVRFLSMGTYLLNMTFQVFMYCYQGTQLSEESLRIADGAYDSQWHRGSVRLRRALLVLMARAQRPLVITAGGFTTLSLSSFMGIVKASYSFFTVLQQVTQKPN